MIKKIMSVLLTVIFFIFGAVTVFASEEFISVGDEVLLVYNIKDVRNVAGVSFETAYNSEYLTAENIVCNISGSETNIKNSGEIKWNFIVYDGMDFNNDDIVTVTFKVLKQCNIDDLAIEYNCLECFNPDLQKISHNPNSLFSVRAIHNNTEYTVNTIGSKNNINFDTDKSDSEISDIENTEDSDIVNTVSDTDITNKATDTDTPETTKNIKDTDKTQNTDTDKFSSYNSDNEKSTAAVKNTSQNEKSASNVKNTSRNEKSTTTVKNNSDNTINTTTLTAAYPQNVSNTAVDTSGSQNLIVTMLLVILLFSGMWVVGLTIKSSR